MFLILAMVASAAFVYAWEQGKTRSAARWADAKARAEERGAQRERRRQERAAEWEARFDSAISRGPRHPLWWGYAAGYLAGGAIAAVGAGVVGAYSGAIAGGKAGHRIGVEAGRQGRTFRDAWKQWRDQKGPVDLGKCQRCGGWITTNQLTETAEYGLVCPDCVPEVPKPEDDPVQPEDVVHERREGDVLPPRCANRCGLLAASGSELCVPCQIEDMNRREREPEGCSGMCRNSDLSSSEAERRGWCPDCAGKGELITDFGGEHRHVPCRICGSTGLLQRRSGGQRDTFVQRCGCGAPALTGQYLCGRCSERRRKTEEANKQKTTSEPEQDGPIRATAERIYPEQEEQPNPKEITTMTAIEPAHRGTVDTAGDGYTSSLGALAQLAALMNEVHACVNDLNESLTANSLDADTLNQLSDLTDGIETVASQATELHRHVENRHEPLAQATADAGGSQNVAAKGWYDEY